MTNKDLVSVVIPTYNRSRILHEAIESVLAQTYDNLELVIIDDGSTDDTLCQLRKYGDRITVISQDNAGPAAARNLGILRSHGDLIAFLDSDDIWRPTKIERQVSLLNRAGTSVPCCLTNIEMRWDGRRVTSFDNSWLHPDIEEGIWTNVSEILATRFVLFNQAVMIRRTALDKNGCFDASLRILEDGDLALRLSSEGPWAFIKEPLVVWRETVGSAYQNASRNQQAILQIHIRVLETNVARLAGKSGPHVQRMIASELKRTRRQLKAVSLGSASSPVATATGAVLQFVEYCRRGAFRRSPFFPQMKTRQIG